VLIVHNIDPRLLGELLHEAARARSKERPPRRRRAATGQMPQPARPDREPGRAGGERTGHVRVAR